MCKCGHILEEHSPEGVCLTPKCECVLFEKQNPDATTEIPAEEKPEIPTVE